MNPAGAAPRPQPAILRRLDRLRRYTRLELLCAPLFLQESHSGSFATHQAHNRDQRGYVVVVTGVLYGTTRRSLHPVREFLFAAGFAFQLRRASPAAVTLAPSLAAFPLRAAPAPRTPFTIYTTDTAARCTVQPTPRYSFIPLPQLSLS